VDRGRLRTLHYIAPVENVSSIIRLGLLCHRGASTREHRSVANESVQGRRQVRQLPTGLMLHDYVNLYFDARNPMMYSFHEQHASLCVIDVSPNVLDLPGVVISDMNASRSLAGFSPSPAGLDQIDEATVFAKSWAQEDQFEHERHAGAKCAEVLVPHRVDPIHFRGLIASNRATCTELVAVVGGVLSVTINPDLFFVH
jgi:hypothetical protein